GVEQSERQAMFDFEPFDGRVAQRIKFLEQLDQLALQPEVAGCEFRTRTVLRSAELDLVNHTRGRVERGVATTDNEILDLAEVDLLHQFDQPSPGRGQDGLGL